MEDKIQNFKSSRQNLSFLKKYSVASKVSKSKLTSESVKEKWNVCSSVFDSTQETNNSASEDSLIEENESPLKHQRKSLQRNCIKNSKLLKRKPVSLPENFDFEFSSNVSKLHNVTRKENEFFVFSDGFQKKNGQNLIASKKVKPSFIFTKDMGASFEIKSAPDKASCSITDHQSIVSKSGSPNIQQKVNVESSIKSVRSRYSIIDKKRTKLHNINGGFNVSNFSSNFLPSKEDIHLQFKSNPLIAALDKKGSHDISEIECDNLQTFPHNNSESEAKQFTLNSFNNISSNSTKQESWSFENKIHGPELESIIELNDATQNHDENSVKSNFINTSLENNSNPVNVQDVIDIQFSSSQSQSDGIIDGESNELCNEKSSDINSDHDDVIPLTSSANYSSTLNNKKTESEDKGSSWLHSLKSSEDVCMKDSVSNDEHPEKLKVKGLLVGGLAEKALKLQRRIHSDKVIWGHKIHDIKNKACNTFLTLVILTVLHCGEIIVAKCSTRSDKEEHETVSLEGSCLTNESVLNDNNWLNSKMFVVLFKKNDFYKFKLNLRHHFRLFYPWEIMSVPLIQYPVILCTHFLEAIESENDDLSSTLCLQSSKIENEKLNRVVDYILPTISRNMDFQSNFNHFGLWDNVTSVSGRIQRIWQHQISSKLQLLTRAVNHRRFSFLLQTENNNFVILKLKSSHENLQKVFVDLVSYGEGNCYRFHDCQVTHRYSKHESSSLFQMLKYLLHIKDKTSVDKHAFQDFCYELFPNNTFQEPDMVTTENFPPYFEFDISPLSLLLQPSPSCLRFNCVAKALCSIKGTVYITDETLLNSQHVKYIRLKGCLNCIPNDSLIGREILVKEACFFEDFLLLDEFSCVIPVHDCRKLPGFSSRLSSIASISLCDLLSPLHKKSRIEDLVMVNGIIVEVNENSALSWLECCHCHKANLLHDQDLVIYCEDCGRSVPKPILNMKMEIIVNCESMCSDFVSIQLLSSTIKRILNISDDTQQPACSIGDVLNKRVNSLFCYVRHHEVKGKKKLFYLMEIS